MSTKQSLSKQIENMELGGRLWPDAMMREEGILLRSIVRKERPSKVIELGRKHGYSTLWILGGIRKEARLLTFSAPISEDVEIATRNIDYSGRSEQVCVINGWTYSDLSESARLAGMSAWKFCFVDACHEADIAWWDTTFCHDGLDVGGVIVVHDLWPCALVGEDQIHWSFTVGELNPPHLTGPAYVAHLLKISGLYEVVIHDTPKGMAECRKLAKGSLEVTPGEVWEKMGKPNIGLYPGAPLVPWRL